MMVRSYRDKDIGNEREAGKKRAAKGRKRKGHRNMERNKRGKVYGKEKGLGKGATRDLR